MKKMPSDLKAKLYQIGKAYERASRLNRELSYLVDKYDFDMHYVMACNDDNLPANESFAFLVNAEGNIEQSIEQFEEVFLWHVNNK